MWRAGWIGTLVAAVAVATGCGGHASGTGTSGADEHGASQTRTTASAATATTCTDAGADAGFVSSPFDAQTGHFEAELYATPLLAPEDAVIGLAATAATSFSGLAAIVRFAPSGVMDVRDGSGYRADVALPYTAGAPYLVKIDVDVPTHVYTVLVTPPGGGEVVLANRYAFRTEQSGVTSLADTTQEVDSSAGGVKVCGFVLDPAAAPSCAWASASEGFIDAAMPSQSGAFVATFDATPTIDGIDSVFGLSAAPASAFTDLAAIVRFAPSGYVDVRNGGAYAASASYPYRGGTTYHVTMNVDVGRHVYSVDVSTGGATPTRVADGFSFRSEQSGVTSLAARAVEVDSASGTFSVCNFALPSAASSATFSEDLPSGGAFVTASTGGHVVVSASGTTTELDAAGRAVRQAAFGGRVATDAAGDLFVAEASGAVTKYDASWRTQWSWGGSGAPLDLAVDPAGEAVVTTTDTVTKLSGNGPPAWSVAAPAVVDAVIDGTGEVFALTNEGGAVVVEKLSAGGDLVWKKTYAGNGTQVGIRVVCDAAGEAFVSGRWYGTIDFGSGPMTFLGNEVEGTTGFLVGLDGSGGLIYATSHERHFFGGMGVDAAGNATIGGEFGDTPLIPVYETHDRTGAIVASADAAGTSSGEGSLRSLAVDAKGNVTTVVSNDNQTHVAQFPPP